MISANHRGQHHMLQKEIIIILIIILIIIKITIIITIIIILIIILLLLNAHLHISWIIPVKFHYNRIKNNALTFMVTMATVPILKQNNPKFTTTHPKNIPIKFHYNRTKTFFLTFHGYHGNDGHIHVLQ
jgi:uncharacterized membrane protein